MKSMSFFRCSVFICVSILPTFAMAANAIQKLEVRRDGDTILVKLQMQNPLTAQPGTWSVIEPPRVVFDFPDTDNRTGSATQQLNEGDLKSVNLVQSDTLTRLVLNLARSTKYTSEIDGRNLFIKLRSHGNSARNEPSPSTYQASATKSSADKQGERASIRDISFRRGDNGQGLVIVDLSDGSVPVDVRRSGNGLLIELQDVDLPDRLQSTRDVNDFATLVNSIASRKAGSATQLQLGIARGQWFHQAKVLNNKLIVEINPVPVDDQNKLVQSGQTGKKVSINFYEAEATMVLRTLAEISERNIMIDPSLAGRKITANLENIPYDEALEIVMAQVGASKRISENLILFADRAVLQSRDMARAVESAQRDETAPLVSEAIQLNFAKASEVRDLLLLGDSSGAGARKQIASGQSAGGQFVSSSNSQAQVSGTAQSGSVDLAGSSSRTSTSGVTSDKTGSLSGVLSSRGVMNVHAESNKLFVTDIAVVIERIREMVRAIDIPPRQVLIEARIVRADNSFGRSLGLRLGYNDVSSTVPGRGIGTRLGGNNYATVGTTGSDLLALTGQSSGGGATLGQVGSAAPQINLPSLSSPTGQFAISVFNSSLTKFINLELQASENEGRTTNISSPRVVTADNLEAKIERGTKVPYSTASSNGTNTQFIDAKLSLTVKPQIAPNGTVILDLSVTNDTVGEGSPPSINTTNLKTKVTVENGGTVVLGGVITDDTANTESRIPYLSDIPYIGNFFKSTNTIRSKGELLIFITPRVMSSTGTSVAQQ